MNKNIIKPRDDSGQGKLEYIYRKFGKNMYFEALEVLGKREDAEDCVHDTFLKLAKVEQGIDISNTAKCRVYVLTAVRNTALNTLARSRAENGIEDIDELEALPSDEADISEIVFSNVNIEKIKDALRRIDPKYRDVMYYRYFEELSEKDISKLLGINYSTVRVRLRRGRSLLVEMLEEGGIRI